MIIYTVFVTSYTNGVENDYTALPFKQHSVFAPGFSLLVVFIRVILIQFHYLLVSMCLLSPHCQIKSKGSFCFMIPVGECHSWLNTSSAHKVLIVEVLKAPAIHQGV